MPIHCPMQLRALAADEFEERDYCVLGQAYASQNELGRLCGERVYEADIQARLLANGFRDVHTQVPATVTHEDFSKRYFLDLVADHALYELKACTSLTGEDDAQLIHYILLMGVARGKLLNFRPPKVQGRLLATSLTQEVRRCVQVQADRWMALTPECARLRDVLLALLEDWGAFLDFNLYLEALVHFLGGEGRVVRRLGLARSSVTLAEQRFHLHAPEVAFRLTALTRETQAHEVHLRRLLALTSLRAMQWFNLCHADIQFVTLLQGDKGMGTGE